MATPLLVRLPTAPDRLAQEAVPGSAYLPGTGAEVTGLAAELALPAKTVRAVLDQPRPLRLHPTARAVLTGLRDSCPQVRVVVCSNLAAVDHAHADLVRDELGPLLDAAYFSCETGHAKATGPEIFEHIARDQQVDLGELVHVGDKILEDVHAPLLAGARALWIQGHHPSAPRPAGLNRYRTAADLASACTLLRDWIPATQPRPTLPVRASVVLRNAHGHLLITRGPDDDAFTLPGGRCESTGPDAPPQAAAREVLEELRLPVHVHDLLYTGWAEAESSTGQNKVHWIFAADLTDTHQPDPDPSEIADYRWVDDHTALRLLAPGDAERLRRIHHGQRHGWQHHSTA